MSFFTNTPLVNAQFSTEYARILVIDDEPLVTRTVCHYLQKAGYQDLHSLNDSRLAIDTIVEVAPDLILLDLIMPHVSGLELLEQIVGDTRFRDASVLVLSSADKSLKYKSIRLGATGFVDKPVSRDDLLSGIEKSLKIL